jgi:hypothetical protein
MRVLTHPHDVESGLGISELYGPAQSPNDLKSTGVYFSGSLTNHSFKSFCLVLQGQMGLDSGDDDESAERASDVVHSTHFESLGFQQIITFVQ